MCDYQTNHKMIECLNLKDNDLQGNSQQVVEMSLYASCPEIASRRSVSFDQVDIREYFIELGDNPSCSTGPPLTIGWEFDHMGSIDLDQFEECRPPRRLKENMLIPFTERKSMLEQMGYSQSEILDAVKSVDLERHQRQKAASTKSLKVARLRERANKTFRHVFHKRKS